MTRHPHATRWRIAALALAGALRAASADAAPASPAGEITGEPVAPLAITGRVSNEEGRPVARAVVRLFVSDEPARTTEEPLPAVTTGADGGYRFEGRSLRGRQWYQLVAQHPSYGFTATSRFMPESLRREVRLSLTLGRRARLEGVVVDELGRPVAGAILSVPYIEAREGRHTTARGLPAPLSEPLATRTDAQGRFRIDSFSAGQGVGLAVSAPGHVDARRTYWIPRGAGVRSAEVTIRRAGGIRGRVTDAETGDPVPGVRVIARADQDSLPEPYRCDPDLQAAAEAETDVVGRYRLVRLLPGRWHVMAEPPCDRALPRTTLPAAGIRVAPSRVADGVDLRLIKAGLVAVRLANARTGESVEDTGHLRCATPEFAGTPFTVPRGPRSQFLVPPGRARVYLDMAEHGRYSVRGWFTRDQVVEVTLAVAAGEEYQVTLKLDPGAAIEGTVLGDDGQPFRGAEVCRRWGRGFALLALADAGGRFRVVGLRPGEEVALYARRSSDLETPEPEVIRVGEAEPARVVLRMRRADPGGVAGRVLGGDGRPAAGIPVSLIPLWHEATPPEAPPSDETIFGSTAWTDAGGRYRIEGIRDGRRYRVYAEKNRCVYGQTHPVVARAGEVVAVADLVIRPHR